MASVINDPLVTKWLDALKAIPGFASLHYEIPDPADPEASEVTGGSYARSSLKWDYVDNSTRALWNIEDLAWLNLETVTIVAVGVWDDPTKGKLLLWAVLDEPIPIADRGSYQVGAHQLFVTL